VAWIESHQALGHHPKTLALAAELKCTLPTAVGYLHYLWWWALDYAQDGVVTTRSQPVVVRACEWHGAPDRFWRALTDAGFVEQVDQESGSVRIHDWTVYAGKLIDQRRKDAERKRDSRRTSPGNPEDGSRKSGARPAVPTNQPDQPTGPDRTNRPPVGPLNASSAARARAANGAPPRGSPSEPRSIGDVLADPKPLRAEQSQCPLCPEVFSTNAELRDHLDNSPRHKVNAEPVSPRKPRMAAAESLDLTRAEIEAELASMQLRKLEPEAIPPEVLAEHERILAMERSRNNSGVSS
jgi:hypothetical protein